MAGHPTLIPRRNEVTYRGNDWQAT